MFYVVWALSFIFAAAAPWYVKYDLTDLQIQNLTESGCYRGLYGGIAKNGDPRRMSLFTCDLFTGDFVASLAEDASLCVVELFSPAMIEQAREVVVANAHQARVLFVGRQELVLGNPLGNNPSSLCFTDQFPGLAANVPFVPERPIRPQSKAEMSHPATIKYLLNDTVRAVNPVIEELVKSVSKDNIQTQLYALATDVNGGNTLITRNSYSIPTSCSTGFKCFNNAVTYITSTITSLFKSTAGVTITTPTFQSNMGPNIVVVIPGKTTDRVILGAHLDSRNNINTNTGNPAPGADDNGTGSSLVLEFARVIATAGTQWQYTLELHWYCGEEQGLLGSKALATSYSSSGVKVVAMFNADMIGYTSATYGVTITFDSASTTLALTNACRNIITSYLPTLKQGTSSGCCTDEQSWYNAGFPAMGIFETPTANVVYPAYHTAQDTVEKVNLDQVYQFTQGLLACVAEYAVPI